MKDNENLVEKKQNPFTKFFQNIGKRFRETFTKENMKKFGRYLYTECTVYIILLVLVILFECFNTKFLSWGNIKNLIESSTFYIIAGMGIMFVMLTGGIDLSVGYIMSISSCTAAILILEFELSLWIVIPICIVIGFLCGLLNGVITAKLKLFPLIVTLATSEVFKGIVNNITQGKTYSGLTDEFRFMYTGRFLGIRIDIWIAIAFVVVVGIILNKTHFGRNVLAVGGGKEAARLSGIKVNLVTALCFAICGGIFAFASLDMMAHENMTSASTGPGTEFTCLTAAIIGGVSMSGGKGNVLGMVVGIFIMQIISNGMQLAGFGAYTQYIVKGIILLAAVTFDVIKNRPHVKKRILPIIKGKGDLVPQLQLDGNHLPPLDGNKPPFPPKDSDFKFAGGKPPANFDVPHADISKIKNKLLDIKYGNESKNQKLDIYFPENKEGPFPAIIYIHGGGFAMGDCRDDHLEQLFDGLKKGYAIIGVEYRLSNEATFPAAVLDVRNAVRFIKENAFKFNINPKRLAAIGGSAGGNLSAMLAMNIPNGNFIGEENLEFKEDPFIKCAVDWFGPTNFKLMDQQARENGVSFCDHFETYSAESKYIGKPLNDADYDYCQLANPMHYVNKDMAKLLIEHGTVDKLVPFAQSQILFNEISKKVGNGVVKFIPLEGADHEDKKFGEKENMDLVWDFFEANL